MLGLKLPEVPRAPSDAVLTRRMTPVSRSFTKISGRSFSSFGTRFVASDLNTTKRPSGVTEGSKLAPSAIAPRLEVLTIRVCPVVRSLIKISAKSLVSPATRFDASDSNTTYRPLELSRGEKLCPFPATLLDEVLIREVFCEELL